MSHERDELIQIIQIPETVDGGPVSCGPGFVFAARTADAILAAGYRKTESEQRMNTSDETVEAIDDAPEGSVGRWAVRSTPALRVTVEEWRNRTSDPYRSQP